jgi:hypothetical protein
MTSKVTRSTFRIKMAVELWRRSERGTRICLSPQTQEVPLLEHKHNLELGWTLPRVLVVSPPKPLRCFEPCLNSLNLWSPPEEPEEEMPQEEGQVCTRMPAPA